MIKLPPYLSFHTNVNTAKKLHQGKKKHLPNDSRQTLRAVDDASSDEPKTEAEIIS